jgi:hypothetical protein
LKTQINPFLILPHSLTDDLLRSHRLPRDASLCRFSLRPRTTTSTTLVSLSLHLSLINTISHSFVTLPEIEIEFLLHFSLHACF